MLIKKCEGYELEKSSPTSPEDAFNRSIVTFDTDGRERTFHLLYLRFFEERVREFKSFQKDPLFTAGEREVTMKDIAGLAAIFQNPSYRRRKRVYVSEVDSFLGFFEQLSVDEVQNVFKALQSSGTYELQSSNSLTRVK